MAASAAYAYSAWQPDAFPASLGGNSSNSGGSSDGRGACAPAWNATSAYAGGSTTSLGSVNYTANYWSQGADPSTHNGGAGSREPWTAQGTCAAGGTTSLPYSR